MLVVRYGQLQKRERYRPHSTSAGGPAEGSQGQALGAQPLDQVRQTRPEGALQPSPNMALVIFTRATVADLQRFSVCQVLYALSRRVVLCDRTQGRRAKRLPLATFCRASGAG